MNWELSTFLIVVVVMVFFAGYFLSMMAKANNKMEDKSEEILSEIIELKKLV